MERRAILALVLSLAVFSIWSRFFVPPPPEGGVEGESTAQSVPADSADSQPAMIPDGPSARQPVGDVGTTPPPSQPEDLPVESFSVENALISAQFTSLDGGIAGVTLHSYTQRKDSGGLLSWLWSGLKSGFDFPPITPPHETPPVELLTGESERANIRFALSGDLAGQATTERVVSKGLDSAVFLSRQGGIEIKKSWRMTEDYLLDLEVSLVNQGPSTWEGKPTLFIAGPADVELSGPMDVRNSISLVDEEAEFEDLSDVDEGSSDLTRSGQVAWYGIGDNYFLSAVLLPEVLSGRVDTRRVKDQVVVGFTEAEALRIEPGSTVTKRYRLYIGPKEFDRLETIGSDMDKSIDFGFFSIFAYPLLALLKFFYSLVGSYGIAIILLTVSMKALTFPLNHKSLQSMQRMKEIQPEIKKLQTEFGENKEALNREMMKLMSEKKVNPLGGCLPTLVQLPVWYALYRVLQTSIELYHTSFLYLDDLSAADPYGASAILLGVLMLLQQKLTPTASVDPNQQRIMQLMPVFMSFIMFGLPSGLVLYILVNSALSIAHHGYFLNRGPARTTT